MGLKQKNPFPTGQCTFGDPGCIVRPDTDCSRMRVVYKLTCNICSAVVDQNEQIGHDRPSKEHNYLGMTAGSLHARMNGHLTTQAAGDLSGPMTRHDKEVHGGVPQMYKVCVVDRGRRLLTLATTEAMWIEKQHVEVSMNLRQEAGRGGIVRLTASTVS